MVMHNHVNSILKNSILKLFSAIIKASLMKHFSCFMFLYSIMSDIYIYSVICAHGININ